MAAILLIIIYIAFIGLGIPDSIFGTAWPVIYPEFNLPVSWASIVTTIVSCGTVVSSLTSAKIINRFGTGRVSAVSTLMTAVGMIGYSFSGSIWWFCLFAVPLGLGAGAIDSALNNYVALHYSSSHMSFLHCFYGVGVSFSPYMLSFFLRDGNWRGGYQTAFAVQMVITAVLVFTLPLWHKVKFKMENTADDEPKARTLPLKELIKLPGVKPTWLMFITSCGIECTCGTWGSTFLVNARGMAAEKAALMLTFYYLGMTSGRFLSGILAKHLTNRQIIRIGMAAILAALVILILPLPAAVSGIGLFMVGLGNGPVFPNLTHLTPINFGRDVSQSVMGTQFAAAYIGSMLLPVIFGALAGKISVGLFPYYNSVLFIVMAFAMLCLFRSVKQPE